MELSVKWLCVCVCVTVVSGSLSLPQLDVTRLRSRHPPCDADLQTVAQGIDTGQQWALSMVDASVRSPVGLMSHTAVHFGDFDGCLALGDEPLPLTRPPQFCMLQVSLAQPDNSSQLSGDLWRWGVCVPSSCSASDLELALQAEQTLTITIPPEACTTPSTITSPFNTSDLLFCVLVALAVLLVIVATVHEVTMRKYDGKSPPGTIWQCLSARHGLHSLLRKDQSVPGVDLSALYGLHSCAFFFVVLGHRFGSHFMFMHLTNYRAVQKMFAGSWYSMWTGHMDLFVDIFFFMSAFLLSVIYYSELHKRYVSPLMVYLQRIVRIVPAYAVVVGFYSTLLRYLGDGPMWNLFMAEEQGNCRRYWWTNLLFINTYVHTDHICLLQSWYISCDFQLFLAGTLLVLLVQRWPRLGSVVMATVFTASTIAPFLATYLTDRPALLLFYKEFWSDPRHHDMFTSVYSQGHYRGTSSIVGLLAGCYVYSHRKQPLSKSQSYLLESAGLVVCVVVYWSGTLFYDEVRAPGRLITAIYAATFHTLFGIGLALLVIAWTIGKSTIICQILSWRGFVPLSKLSYCVYLIHNIPQFVWLASSRAPVYINPLELVSWTIADVGVSLVAALLLYLTVETPTRYIVKYIISGAPEPSPLPKTVDSQPQERYIIQNLYEFPKSTDSSQS